jgi:NADPH-dependent curcumin reductase CurA
MRVRPCLLITAAASAVGQLAGQIAKMKGMKVIGSTESPEKVEFLRGLEFYGAWDYHTETTAAALGRLAPDGVDVFLDNVGGEQLETAILSMNDFGFIGRCSLEPPS